jgi:L-asparagine transporter-like permease
MVAVGYIVPVLVAVGATDYHQSEWVDGHLGTVAVDIGGRWLGAWTILAAGISNVAMFEAEMSSDAFKIMGMAERGYLPKCFEARSKYGTPTAGIITNTIVVIVFSCAADFGQLLELLNCTYAISVLLEYAAFVKLRLFHKELQRPYRIPIPDWASVLLVLPPSIGIVCIFATSNWWVYTFSLGAVLFSYTLSKFAGASKKLS